MTSYISPPPMNPLSRLIAGVLAVLALAAAFFFGFIVLMVVVGAGLIGWLALGLALVAARRRRRTDGRRV